MKKSKSKYTIKGNAAFDKVLDAHLEHIAETVKNSAFSKDVAAIMLGGGYGRGEGGVFKSASGKMKLYNDLDFFVVTRNVSCCRRKKINGFFKDFGRSCSWEVGVDVDFSAAKTIRELKKMAPTMMWQELRAGHKVVYGKGDVLRSLPVCELNNLPLEESLRLLLNRGVGLFLARERLAKGKLIIDDRDFAGRNLFKAALACGDVTLLLRKQYSLSVIERLAALDKFAHDDMLELYRRAVDFKCLPKVYPLGELRSLCDKVVDLFEKSCFEYFSICCGSVISNIGELDMALKHNNPFTVHDSFKTRFKYLIQNLLYMRRLRPEFGFSASSPRLELLRCLLALLFEHCRDNNYIINVEEHSFFTCWKKFN
jgi:hypothetical protein